MYTDKYRESGNVRRQKNVLQIKKQDKSPEKDLNRMKTNNLPNKELKVIAIKMLTKLKRRIGKHSENVNKDVENIRKYQSKAITELKNTLEGFSISLDKVE